MGSLNPVRRGSKIQTPVWPEFAQWAVLSSLAKSLINCGFSGKAAGVTFRRTALASKPET